MDNDIRRIKGPLTLNILGASLLRFSVRNRMAAGFILCNCDSQYLALLVLTLYRKRNRKLHAEASV